MRDCGCNDPHGPGVRPGSLHGLACSKPEPKVKLATVILQAQVGSDEEGQPYAPKFGKYTNTVVKYLANDAVYVYDGEGVFTLFSKHGEVVEGDDGYINGDQLFQIKTALEEMDEQLQQQIADETEAREAKDQELEEAIEQEETARIEAVEQLTNDLDEETKAREEEDNNLQSQLDAMAASTDVIDVVDTYADLQGYDTANVHLNDIVKVLNDETHEGAITYYRWDGSKWNYVGSTGPYYTKAEADDKFGLKEDVENALGEIAEMGADKQDKLVGEGEGQNIKTINGESILGEGNIEVEGGGGKLYSEYGDNEDGGLTQKFTTSVLNGVSVAIGRKSNHGGAQGIAIGYEANANGAAAIAMSTGATANGTSTIALGSGTTAGNEAIGIGRNAKGAGSKSIGIGWYADAKGESNIAIGTNATTSQNAVHAIALGDGAQSTRSNEFSIGTKNLTRFVANVTAGELDTDAVNVKQLNDAVGDITAVLARLSDGAGV